MLDEISEAIMQYLDFGYATPKELFKEIYPIFGSRYKDEDSFRRLLHRNLKRLLEAGSIVKHSFGPYYCLPGNEWMLNLDIKLALKKFKPLRERKRKVIVASGDEGGEYTFAEYFLLKHRERKRS